MTKKVLVVTESLRMGGAESVAVDLANALQVRGYNVVVAAATGVLESRLISGVARSQLPHFSFLGVPKMAYRLFLLIKRFQPDVVHLHGATWGLIARMVCLLFRQGVPRIVLTYHSLATERIPNFLSGFFFNFIVDKLLVVARHRERSLIQLGVSPKKIKYIPNCIDFKTWDMQRQQFDRAQFLRKHAISESDSILLCSARLIKSKRVDVFLNVVAGLVSQGNAVTGIILGSGPEFNYLRELARTLGIESRILFAGFQADVKPFYFAAHVFLFPTEIEVLPMSLIEAAAAGVPIVCSAIEGNAEIVSDTQNGFLVEGDVKTYVEKVSLLLRNKDMRDCFSLNSRRKVSQEYGLDSCLSELIRVYEN